MILMPCETCGVPVMNPVAHITFHEALNALARQVCAPDATDEEWAELQVQAATYGILRQEELRVQAEEAMSPEQRARVEMLRRLLGHPDE